MYWVLFWDGLEQPLPYPIEKRGRGQNVGNTTMWQHRGNNESIIVELINFIGSESLVNKFGSGHFKQRFFWRNAEVRIMFKVKI